MIRYAWALALLLALSQPAAAQLRLERTVRGNIVTSARDPAARVTMPSEARYVGGERWTLYDAVDCEVHVFVEADAGRQVKRFYWIQFEQYLPSAPNGRYDYSDALNRSASHWGMTVRVRARFGPTSELPKPDSDGAHVRALIERAGYTLPTDMMNVRFVKLADDPQDSGRGRKEMMLLYVEDMADEHVASAELIDGGRISARWAPVERRLIARAASRFDVKLDE